jgi:antitoxin MazE
MFQLDKHLWQMYLLCRHKEGDKHVRTRIQKWGNSLAVRIPKSFAVEIGLEQDLPVEVSLEGEKLVILPARESKVTLERLLALVTEDNVHHEVDTGPAVGDEAW